MLDFLKRQYVLEGKAFDLNTLFRVNAELVEHAVTDMAMQGYMPVSMIPDIETWDCPDNTVGYLYKWRIKKFEFNK